MAELKATTSGEIRARDTLLGYWWYEKSEADKAIAELQSKVTLASLADDCSNLRHKRCNYCSELQRQKYKRCLAMAKMCQEKAAHYRAEYNAEEGFGDGWLKWIRWARKWGNRWLAIAEKFKKELTNDNSILHTRRTR